MNCARLSSLLAAGAPLSGEAREHLSHCPICSKLSTIGDRMEAPPIDTAAEQRIIAAITADLAAVRPVAASWRYVLALLAAAIFAAALGIGLLGAAGWRADTLVQRAWFTASLGAGMTAAAVLLSRLMIPGALLPLSTRAAAVLAVSFVAAGALLYPAAYYHHFERAAAACLGIGLAQAAAAGALALWVLRRGAFLSRPDAAAALALLGGLTGVLVLFVFCPHRDLGHFTLGHSPVPIAAMALGAWIARRFHWTGRPQRKKARP